VDGKNVGIALGIANEYGRDIAITAIGAIIVVIVARLIT
jgi:hypothetical protein